MADFDLTHRMTPFFDVHLVIPLLEFIEARKIYSEESLVKVQRNVLLKTNMIDSLIETYPKDKVPEGLITRKDEILAQRKRLKEEADEILTILEKPEVKELIENKSERESGTKLTELLAAKHGFKPEMLDTLFKTLVSPTDKNFLNALYGKLASEILLQEWVHAKNDLMRIRLFIENNPFNDEIELIKHRAWVMHWALFVCFNNPEGRDEIIDMFLNVQQYANAIQIVAPHLLRYLAVAIVTSKHKQTNSLKELVKLLESYGEHYKDPITEFLTCLYIKYDFNEAQKYLKQCQGVLANDFFLTAYADEFNEACRLLVFESFCRIHNCVKLDMLAERLNMDTDEAEKWIVDLIRKYKIEGAKIDSQNREVVMTPNVQSLHEQVMESTKRIYTRIHSMVMNLEKIQLEREVQDGEVY